MRAICALDRTFKSYSGGVGRALDREAECFCIVSGVTGVGGIGGDVEGACRAGRGSRGCWGAFPLSNLPDSCCFADGMTTQEPV